MDKPTPEQLASRYLVIGVHTPGYPHMQDDDITSTAHIFISSSRRNGKRWKAQIGTVQYPNRNYSVSYEEIPEKYSHHIQNIHHHIPEIVKPRYVTHAKGLMFRLLQVFRIRKY